MSHYPTEPKQIKARIRRYERELRQEMERFGSIDDSSGKRYLLGPLYLLMGDLPGAVRSFEWFDGMFPDDIGEPFHSLCWSLALYRVGDLAMAAQKLRHTMLSNLYLIPHLLGEEQAELDVWHSSNFATKDYIQYLPPELEALWDAPARQWARVTYHSGMFQQVRRRYIELFRELKDEPPGPRRNRLVKETFKLRDWE